MKAETPQDRERILYDGWEDLLPPREISHCKTDPWIQYFRWTWGWYNYLILIANMKMHDSVLELGCNTGRTMLGLLAYLKPPGRYEGLDILRDPIEYAQNYVHTRFPHFNFKFGDLYNSLYNPQGKVEPAEYEFPYDDNSFDILYAASVFTHLVPAVTANYFKQSRRVLRKGGRCLYSFFILDNYRGKGTTNWDFLEFEQRLEGCGEVAVRDEKSPDQIMAYKLSLIEKLATDAGLKVVRVLPGLWSGSHEFVVSEQDLVMLEAA
jgi:SAM-dependent methyltransferase